MRYPTLAFALPLALSMTAFAADTPKLSRYCNPLPMINAPGASASGDVTVIKDNGKYYMYCTAGGAWISEDLLTWTHQGVTFQGAGRVPVAPHVGKYKNAFYMCGNDVGLYKADNPLGPYADLGQWKNTGDQADGWRGAFDVDIFVDDDGKPYLYFPGRGVTGIFVVPLDPDDLTKFAAKPTHLFGFNKDHIWERYGEMNEYPEVAWIEGPWMQKYKGTYYLEYSASGTQWKTYAEGYCTSKNPMGPFAYAPNNPLLRNTEGLVTGTAHGSVVEGPDGNLWQFYTIVLSNPPGGRRVGMDRVTFDKDGNMACKITDTPQWAPTSGKTGDSGSIPVSINKLRAMNARGGASAANPGRDATYAIDNSSGTWWEPAATDTQPTMTLELSPATRFDVVQLFTVDSVRLLFTGGGGMGGAGRGTRGGGAGGAPGGARGGGGAGTAPAPEAAPAGPTTNAFQYKIEVSSDGNTFTTVLDQTNNTIVRNTIFEEFAPTQCRYVRLTMTNWPRSTPLGIIEFTVFGKSTGSLPAPMPIPQ
jgi:xylan 1,4-beta-xylosidase